MTSTQTTSGASAQRRFAYDRWGNRTGVWNAVTGGTQIQSVSLVESSSIPNNQIASVTENSATSDYTYDAAGNVTDDDVNTFVYDAENRLVSVNSGAEQYKYDHQNRRVAKTVGSVTTQYVWEGSKVIAEHAASSGNVLVDYVFMGGRMVKKVEGSTTRYIVSDRLSARMMLDEDYDVVGKQSHLPFGEAMAESGEQEKHHFTSYERDSSTGLDYAVNRWHSSGVGRFLQADPYRASGGLKHPQSWNRYSYTKNDPINRIDPLGLWDCFFIYDENEQVIDTECFNWDSPNNASPIEEDSPNPEGEPGQGPMQPRSGPCDLVTPGYDDLPQAMKDVLIVTFGMSGAANFYANLSTYDQAVFVNTLAALIDAELNLSNARFKGFYYGDHPNPNNLPNPFGVVLEGITKQDLDKAGLKKRSLWYLFPLDRRSPGDIREGSVEASEFGSDWAFDVDLWNPVSEPFKHLKETRWNSRHNATTHPADVLRALERRGANTFGVKCR